MTVINYKPFLEKHGGQILDLGGWLHNGHIFNAVGWSSRLNCTAAEYVARLDTGKQPTSTPKPNATKPGTAPAQLQETDKQKPPVKKESTLILEALAHLPLCNFQSRPYMIDGNRAIIIGSRESRDFISYSFYSEKHRTPTENSIREAFSTLRGKALFESETRPVFKRVANHAGKVYIDLADQSGTIIEIDSLGVRVAEHPPVLFLRPDGMKPLPVPELPGSIGDLQSFFNIKNNYDFRLLVVWMISVLRGRPNERGSYAILYVKGPAGAAKTSACKIIQHIIDPATPETRTPPKEIRDIFIAGGKRHLISFDNISSLDAEMQDATSSMITGGGYARKENYSDLDETIFESCNPMIFNGIEFKRKPDFQDRCVDLELDEISPDQRITEAELWERVEKSRPVILGGLLTLLSGALLEIEKGIELLEKPRLADFGKLAVAVERAAGWEPGSTLEAFNENQNSARRDISEGTPLLKSIVDYLRGAPGQSFSGTASELLERIKSDDVKNFPQNPQKLSAIIQRNVGILRALGVTVSKRRSHGERIYDITMGPESGSDEMTIPF